MREGIKYKDVTAMPGSDLHRLLSESRATKDQKLSQELRKKAERCYTECLQRHQRSIGELKFHGWAPTQGA